MPPKVIVSDWNGTLFQDKDEGKLWEYVAFAGLKRHPSVALAALQLYRLKAAYKRGEIGYDKIYDAFNKGVLSRMKPDEVEKYIDAYAMLNETQAKVDNRLWRPIDIAHSQGVKTAVLSTGSHRNIRAILRWHGQRAFSDSYPNEHSFDRVVANYLVPAGNGSMFDYRKVFDGLDKRTAFLKLHHILNIPFQDMVNILYIGDSETDVPTMELVKGLGGKIAASFFASDDFKQQISKDFSAHVPESEEDFARFLKVA